MITTYRDHGHALRARHDLARRPWRSCSARTPAARAVSAVPCNMFDVEHNSSAATASLADISPLAAGVALKIKYQGESRFASAMGEGATNIGGFHEALSLAALWKLPAVFIVENNEYSWARRSSAPRPSATSRSRPRATACTPIASIPPTCSRCATSSRRPSDHARAGNGPALIEILTYRYRGHSMSDPGKYRTPEEVELRKQKDCVRVARKTLLDSGVPNEEVEAIDASVEEEIRDAVGLCRRESGASEALMHKMIYAKSPDFVLTDPECRSA